MEEDLNGNKTATGRQQEKALILLSFWLSIAVVAVKRKEFVIIENYAIATVIGVGNGGNNGNSGNSRERCEMNIAKRICELEKREEGGSSAFVGVTLADGRSGRMLWTEAVLAAIDGKVVDVGADNELSGLVRAMM